MAHSCWNPHPPQTRYPHKFFSAEKYSWRKSMKCTVGWEYQCVWGGGVHDVHVTGLLLPALLVQLLLNDWMKATFSMLTLQTFSQSFVQVVEICNGFQCSMCVLPPEEVAAACQWHSQDFFCCPGLWRPGCCVRWKSIQVKKLLLKINFRRKAPPVCLEPLSSSVAAAPAPSCAIW